jgi:hypothetical protein
MAPLGQICSTPLLRHELQGQTLSDGEIDLLSSSNPGKKRDRLLTYRTST